MELREDQVRLKRTIYGKIKEGADRILICAPCGYGKTVLLSSIVKDAVKKNKKVLIILPSVCLIDQTVGTFAEFDIETGVIAGDYREDRTRYVQIATLQILYQPGRDWFDYDICIMDECHVLAFSAYFNKYYPLLRDGVEIKSKEQLRDCLEKLGYDSSNIPSFEIIRQQYYKYKNDYDAPKIKAYNTIERYRHVWGENEYREKKTIVLGLTATPWRLNKKESFADVFN